MPPERTVARVGDLEFPDRYGDPTVDVTTEANTVEKQTVTDDIVVQHLGRRADRITIDGIILEDDVYYLDKLVESGEVSIRTHRWAGDAIVMETSSNYTHSYDIAPPSDVASEWVYEVRIDLVETDEIPGRATSIGLFDEIGDITG